MVERQPVEGILVNDVYKTNNPPNKCRILHRNMRLSFMGLPTESLCWEPKSSRKDDDGQVLDYPERSTINVSTYSDSELSLSEKSRKHVIPQRRRSGQSGLLPGKQPSGFKHATERIKSSVCRGTKKRSRPHTSRKNG